MKCWPWGRELFYPSAFNLSEPCKPHQTIVCFVDLIPGWESCAEAQCVLTATGLLSRNELQLSGSAEWPGPFCLLMHSPARVQQCGYAGKLSLCSLAI